MLLHERRKECRWYLRGYKIRLHVAGQVTGTTRDSHPVYNTYSTTGCVRKVERQAKIGEQRLGYSDTNYYYYYSYADAAERICGTYPKLTKGKPLGAKNLCLNLLHLFYSLLRSQQVTIRRLRRLIL